MTARTAAAHPARMLDEKEFLSPYGVRALSRATRSTRTRSRRRPATIASTTSRPSRRRASSAATRTGAARSGFRSTTCSSSRSRSFTTIYGDDFKVECPTGSGSMMTLWRSPTELSRRLIAHLLRGRRGPSPGVRRERALPDRPALARSDPVLRVLPRRHGRGLGASHQTGWTALVAKLLQQSGPSMTPTDGDS